jgi:hypothetical protein
MPICTSLAENGSSSPGWAFAQLAAYSMLHPRLTAVEHGGKAGIVVRIDRDDAGLL